MGVPIFHGYVIKSIPVNVDVRVDYYLVLQDNDVRMSDYHNKTLFSLLNN